MSMITYLCNSQKSVNMLVGNTQENKNLYFFPCLGISCFDEKDNVIDPADFSKTKKSPLYLRTGNIHRTFSLRCMFSWKTFKCYYWIFNISTELKHSSFNFFFL